MPGVDEAVSENISGVPVRGSVSAPACQKTSWPVVAVPAVYGVVSNTHFAVDAMPPVPSVLFATSQYSPALTGVDVLNVSSVPDAVLGKSVPRSSQSGLRQ